MENSNQILFKEGNGGLPKVTVHTEFCDAEVYFQGAHVTHFQRKGEAPLLFMSEKSRFEKGHPIRGGVPIIFPWFGPREGLQMHGFARNQSWELKEISQGKDSVKMTFRLPHSSEFPLRINVRVEYSITLGENLLLELKTVNESSEPFSFDDCLHSYFSVGDIGEVSVTGLNGIEYLDKVGTPARQKETAEAIKFSSETDRIYLGTTSTVTIEDAKLKRKIMVEKEGSKSTVVWNPWIAKSKSMVDFGDEEYLRMVCVESGNVSENKLTVPGGGSASLKVRLWTTAL